MKWKINHFKELDKSTLYKLLQKRVEVFIVEQECPYLDCDGQDSQSYHLYAKQEDQIVAYARIIPPGISYQEASIGRVLVTKNFRGQGLGRKLMNKAINYIEQELQETKIKISAQRYLTEFYNSLGFTITSEPYLEDGIPHIDMLYEQN